MKNRGGLACSPIFERFYLSSTKIVVVAVFFYFFVVVVVVFFLQKVFEENVFSACHSAAKRAQMTTHSLAPVNINIFVR